MDPSLADLALWIRDHPWILIAITGLGPLALGLVVDRLGRRSSGAAPEAETRVERETLAEQRSSAESVATPPVAEPERAAEPAPVAEPERAAEPEPVAEPEPTAEPEPVAEPEPTAEPEPAAPPEPIAEPAPVVAPEPAVPAPPPAPKARLRDRILKTREALVGRLGAVLGGRPVDEALLEELEEVLFTADLGVATAESLLERVRREARGGDADQVRALLKQGIAEMLGVAERSETAFDLRGQPHVILVLGVNGSGKTTTIGKLAARHRALGHSVVLGAGDTFRAAAIEQLQTWGERVGCDVIAGEAGGDPASVAFDTIKAAIARKADVAIIDTAGRLQTKKPLMEELGKIVRVIGRDLPDAPHEILLVLDANTGQNAISQARLFTEVADVSGLVLTKMDGTAKGGVIVGLAHEFRIPVHFVGVGEGIDDLREFDASEFVDALFGDVDDER
jgi:fused signal recognition particle receptor